MLKMLAVFGVVLSVASAFAPASGQTPNKGVHYRKDESQSANASVNPSQSAMPVAAQDGSGDGLKPKSDSNPGDHQQATINISNSATVTEWTWHDKVAWFVGLVLTGFLVWGVIVARNTLKAIEDQTKETARSAKAAEVSNAQNAEFFRAEKRPWVGIVGELSMQDKKSTKPGSFGFTLKYVFKNFGATPAFNIVIPFGTVLEGKDINNYNLVKGKVDEARKSGENILNMTGDVLFPGEEKTSTCEFSGIQFGQKFIITGCIVYRFADDSIHHTELSYWIDLAEGEKAKFRTLWFQGAD